MNEPASTPVPSTPPPVGSSSTASPPWTPLLVLFLAVGASASAYYIYRSSRSTPTRNLAAEAQADLEKRAFKPLSEPLQELLADQSYRAVPTQTHPLLHEQAPDFQLTDVNGTSWSLHEHLKKGPVVVVFYFGYHCDHCVSQLFGLNKDLDKFKELGATVVALSPDPADFTRKRYAEYGPFHFPVLSDPKNEVANKYSTYTPSPKAGEEGDLMHGTFVLDRQGKILWTNRGDQPFVENRTLLRELAKAEGRLAGQ